MTDYTKYRPAPAQFHVSTPPPEAIIAEQADHIEALKARLDEVTAALKKYGTHGPACAANSSGASAASMNIRPCTCGLTDALKVKP